MLSITFERRILHFLLCLLGVSVLTACAPKPNHFGLIFISDNGVVHTADIYRMSVNTQNKIEQLTFTPTIGEYHLLVSKNGDRLVFEADPTSLMENPAELAIEEFQHIYLLDTAGKKLEDMTDIFSAQPFGTETSAIDWSSDQKQFAVLTYEKDPGIMDLDGMNKKLISFPTLGEIPNIEVIKWSPDGKKLAMNRQNVGLNQQLQNPGWALLIYDLESGELRQLADYQTNCLLPKWSPTGQQVAVTCANFHPNTEIPGPNTVRILSIKNPGQPYEHLALSPCMDPSWSPDGKRLAFACDKGADQMGLFTINSDGNGIHEVKLENLGNPPVLRYPSWSPDGNQIIYVAGTNYEHENIYSINPDGTNNHPLTHQEASYQDLSVYPIP